MPSTRSPLPLAIAIATGLLATFPPARAEDPVRVDLLFVYTPAARAYAGSTSAMRASLHSYVALTNAAYRRSEVNVTLKLVGATEVSYTENASMATDLSRLANPSDGYMDSVHAQRTSTGADLVCLIRRDGAANVAGIAYLGNGTSGFASHAFSVVGDIWADGIMAFPHEIGHNFGCHHDHDNGSGAAQPYAYGHRFTGTDGIVYRTIMAYAPGTRIAYFSNPSLTYQGVALGVESGAGAADNALMHDVTASTTAGFRSVASLAASGVRGDFDGDGGLDLVLQNTGTGERRFWRMSGSHVADTVVLPTGNPAWRIATTADFNRDGHTDFVFQNVDTGERCIWLMSGTARARIVALPAGNPLWEIAAAGDFNRDGHADLVYENSATGERCIWLMSGTTRLSVVALPTGAPTWKIACAADFNSDGSPDLAYQNTATGERCIWLMNGTARATLVTFPTGSAHWRIATAGDMNGDGKPDLVFENLSTGERSVWFMNGTTRTGVATLGTLEPQWRIANR